ncbi:apolipoprotein A-I-like isoform X6 [Trematomus bernacchii]|uniref:apolipoprotein A-I-like isoform X6 n=1 Tax=Trematomus bernacchii TaxID=40690 RepID=UPI00146E2D00|nr:apolipoprotein A-I-like isoform X6 [Trematomus bernacchii]
MKVLVVLALAVFTGCNANILYADAPKPQIELLTEAFHDYVAKAKETADDTFQMIEKSQFGKHVNDLLGYGYRAASDFASAVFHQLAPTGIIHYVDIEIGRVAVQIHQRVEQLKQELAPYAESLDTEALRATLEQKSEELKQSVKDLQVHRQLIQRANQVQEMAAPYVEDLKVKLEPYAEDLQARLTSLYEACAKST